MVDAAECGWGARGKFETWAEGVALTIKGDLATVVQVLLDSDPLDNASPPSFRPIRRSVFFTFSLYRHRRRPPAGLHNRYNIL